MRKYVYRPVESPGYKNGITKRTQWHIDEARIVAWVIVSPEQLVLATVASRREARNIVSLLNRTPSSARNVAVPREVIHLGNIDALFAS